MIELKGKYNSAKIFATTVENEVKEQVLEMLNLKAFENYKIRIQADTHAGKGCVIGFTATNIDKVVPNMLGVDLSCGMLAFNLGIEEIDLEKLDNFIRNKIPHGSSVNQKVQDEFISNKLVEEIKYISEKTDSDYEKHLKAIGSLGSGNHFIELNNNSMFEKYIVVHTGSRNFGHRIATYHQNKAVEYCKIKSKEFNDNRNKRIGLLKQQGKQNEIQSIFEEVNIYDAPKHLAFLEDELMDEYFRDIKIANDFAIANRETIVNNICKFLGRSYSNNELLSIHTIHNYFDGITIRKGSISANENEVVLIPINMRDGSIIAKGKGNKEYNESAPHGAGRLMSRTKAKLEVKLEDFKESMKDVYTTSVNENTIDESPFAYKNIDEIINNTKDTIEILDIIKPIYNFKSN